MLFSSYYKLEEFFLGYFSMASKILVVADASSKSLAPILDSLGALGKERLNLRVFFLFCLFFPKKKLIP
ncbi:MAG: hypothetical protein A2026_22420 [Deltaproteobacteria bacterium RBG_19FT_COMBO_46_12]|nr:MAG: hypothetical protein A2026_22420 [Deltaproteobacteria bacterium RBG_19FT_COMBO_46_12]